MAGTIHHGDGPASAARPSAVPGTLWLATDGPLEYRGPDGWETVTTSPAAGVGLADDFLGASGTTLPAPLATQDTSAAGTPTLDYVDDAASGAYELHLATDSEVEAITLYFGDQLILDVTKKPIVEFRLKLEPDVTGAGGALAAGDILVFGLASARAAILDDITTHAWFRLEGANNNILIETDDGTTDTDDIDTGVDWVANTYLTLRVDCTSLANVRFYIDGVLIEATMDMSVATGNVQPFIEVTKAAALNFDHRVTVDYLDIRTTGR